MPPPRIVLDTNVLISGLCFGGVPARVLQAAIEGKIDVFTSSFLLEEFKAVMLRKSPDREAEIMDTLNELSLLWEIVAHPRLRLRVVAEDPSDDRVLECALSAKADCIVSGDKHLLKLGLYRGIRILPPERFLRWLSLGD